MTKHTPGPWHVDPEYVLDVHDLSGREIAVCGYFRGPASEAADNAKLISKAPKMKELLKRFVDAYRWETRSNNQATVMRDVCTLLKELS